METGRSALRFLLLVSMGLLLTVGARSQTVNGSFRGTVKDQSGGVIPGAVVTATNTATGVAREAKTNSTGSYVLPDMAPGVYSVKVSFTGFSTLQNRDVTLLVNQIATLDFVLRPGVPKQEVTVQAQAPLANLTDSTVSTVIGSQQVVQLPLNGRQFTQLILLSPGAAPEGSPQQSVFEIHTSYGGISPAVNGNGPEMNNFTIDGVENNELFFNFPAVNPPPDAIQEFNVQTDMSSGQYGQGGGANVNVVTKSGTNQFHGDAWEFLRNTGLDARNFFSPTVSTYHHNQFGGTFGGPIKRDKAWIFGWYEGFRESLGSTILGLVPTAAQLNGDLAGLPQIYNPYTTTQIGTDAQGSPIFSRAPFPNNQIPSSMLNSAALAVAKFVYPAPNYSASGVNYVDSEPEVTNTDNFGIRIDAAVNEKTTLFGRFAWDHGTRVVPSGIPSEPTNQVQLGAQQVLGLTHTFSPTTVLDVHAQYLRTNIGLFGNFPPVSFLETNGLLTDWPAETGLRPVMPSMSIAGIEGVPGVSQSEPGDPINNWEISSSLTKIVGKHTLNAGGSVLHTWVLDNCTYASGDFDNLPTDNPQNSTTTGAGLASFLLGLPSGASDLRGTALLEEHGNYYGGYFDDVWKSTPNLTVTLGLRYDYASPFIATNDAALDYAHSTASHTVWLDTGKNPLTGAPPNAPSGIFPPARDNWGPRVAFAYRLPHDLVIRSGYGIFYDFNQSNVQNQQTFMGQWPYGLPDIIPSGINVPAVGALLPDHVLGVNVFPPFVPSVTPPSNPGFAADPTNYDRPSVQDWDFGIDKSFGNDWMISATYLGNKGTHTVMNPYLNTAISPGPGNPQLRARLPQFAPFIVVGDWGNSTFEAGELEVERRFSHGLTLLFSYTHSKYIDYDDSANSAETIQDGLDFDADRAVSNYDVPENFVSSFVYNLPFGAGGRYLNSAKWVSKYLLGGWQTTGILTLHSGFPFPITVPSDNANIGTTEQRPTLIGKLLPPGFQQNVQHWFNTSALTEVPYTFGNLGRNVLRADGTQNLDFGLFKRIHLTESKSVQFRAEFFNLFNTPIFGPPDDVYGDPTFGQLLSAGNPRFVQFGLKLFF